MWPGPGRAFGLGLGQGRANTIFFRQLAESEQDWICVCGWKNRPQRTVTEKVKCGGMGGREGFGCGRARQQGDVFIDSDVIYRV